MGCPYKLVLLFLLCMFISLTTAPPATAQQEGEFWGRPWWMNALSMMSSVMAVACIAIAVAELGVKHQIFWAVQMLAVILIIMGLILVEYGSPLFWLAAFVGIVMAAVIVNLFIAVVIAKKLAGR